MSAAEEKVILVDGHDRAIGEMEKMEAHEKGLLHRAFSVFIFNSKGELMLQRRAKHKYHSGGLWTNTCCSHPRSGEETLDAAHRRMHEEMGFDCVLEQKFHFIYNAVLDNDLTEHELDHVIFGTSDKTPNINPEEVDAWKYMSLADIEADIAANSAEYTEWFKICFAKVLEVAAAGNVAPNS